MRKLMIATCLTTTLASSLILALPVLAETVSLDASRIAPEPQPAPLKLGTSTAPGGHSLGVNTRFLTRDGKAWLPVMGEFHYSRVPREDWEAQLLKMKAGGVEVIAVYEIWQHHQDKPGVWNFSGNRDLRAFVELAAKHGLYVYLRPGPWVHAEVRFGGLPDFVVDQTKTRSNDPAYLAYVDQWFRKIGTEVKGLMYKDGGPIIGTQVENEYNRNGEGQGAAHIARLKEMLIAAGFDTPLYSATGWDNAVLPRGEVIPVFGSYVDEPWQSRPDKLPPKTSYVFQFGVRNEQGLGAIGSTSTQDDGARDSDITPFFGAEYGGGLPVMYRRRPLLPPADISAMVMTKIGSGVNLLGYYMYQGGQNPEGSPTREETIAIGGYNDLPKLGYDFQAPLGQYGQAHGVYFALKPIHAFLNAFGDRLAPMEVYAPQVKAEAADLKTLRFAYRGDATGGFLFVNNHVREYQMAEHKDVTFAIKTPTGTVTLPRKGVDIKDGQTFIWPVGFDLSGVRLDWATVQPVTRITDKDGDLYVFMANDSLSPELAFAAAEIKSVSAGRKVVAEGRLIVDQIKPGTLVKVVSKSGKTARLLILKTTDAQHLTAVDGRLVISDALVYQGTAGGLELEQTDADFAVSVYPAFAKTPANLKRAGAEGLFTRYQAKLKPVTLTATATLLRAPGKAPPLKMTGPRGSALIPEPESFGASGLWQITLPPEALKRPDYVREIFLDVNYQADVARLFAGGELIDDEFYNGLVWRVGLKRYGAKLEQPVTLGLMPLREDAKIYLDESARPKAYDNGQVAKIVSLTLTPLYGLHIEE
jgi:beta-galactosidase